MESLDLLVAPGAEHYLESCFSGVHYSSLTPEGGEEGGAETDVK